MKKKVFSLILAAVMSCAALAGCGSDSGSADQAASSAASAAAEAVSEAADDAAEAASEPAAEAVSEAADDAAESASEPAAEAAAPADGEKWTIGLEYSASSCEFCQNFADAVKEYGEAAGFNVILTQGNRSVTNQMTNVEGMISQGCQIIGGFWDDPDACMPIMTVCKEKDLWCIGVLCPLTDRGNGYEKYRFVGSENYNGGHLEGESAAENLPENAKILMFRGTESDVQDIDRYSGFMDALEEAGRDDIEILDEQYAHNNRDEGL